MGDAVFVNGRAAVHKGSNGKSVAFPDVCLCPPAPPTGPVPVPLTNTVVAPDLGGGAPSVLIEGNPAGTRRSFFKKSTGDEASRPTGGGIMTAAVQGRAHFRFSHSMNVFFEGEPAVRHGDLLTHNHVATSGNTPPAPWISTVDPAVPRLPPSKVVKVLREGDDWIRISLLDESGAPLRATSYALRTTAGTLIEGHLLDGGVLEVRGVPKGRCGLDLPAVDETCARLNRREPPRAEPGRLPYRPQATLTLDTGKRHEVIVPAMVSFWVDLPIRVRDAATREDRFILRSGDGSYEVVRTVKDDRVRGDDGLTLEFPGIRAGLTYALVHDSRADGRAYSFFEDRPFDEMFPRDPPRGESASAMAEVPPLCPEVIGEQVVEREALDSDSDLPEVMEV